MKLHATLCLAWCFLSTVHLARSSTLLKELGFEDMVKAELKEYANEKIEAKGDENYRKGFEAMKYIASFIHEVIPDPAEVSHFLNDLRSIPIFRLTAIEAAKVLLKYGEGEPPYDSAPPHLAAILAMFDEHISAEDRYSLLEGITQTQLGKLSWDEMLKELKEWRIIVGADVEGPSPGGRQFIPMRG